MKKLAKRFEVVPLSELPKDIVPVSLGKSPRAVEGSRRMLRGNARGHDVRKHDVRKSSGKAGE